MTDRGGARTARQAALLCVGLWLVAEVFYLAPFLSIGRLEPRLVGYFSVCGLVGMAFCWGIFLALRAGQRLPRRRRLATGAGVTLAALGVHTVFDSWLYDALMHPAAVLGRRDPAGVFEMLLLTNLTALASVYAIFATGVALALSDEALRERERSLADARAAAQEAQLAALRFQINPHFLFNALNAVTSLVGAGRNAEAQGVVGRLSSFFRASLSAPPGAVLPLEEELDVIGSYLQIEATRFGPRLAVEIDAPSELMGAMIPHFLLQPLVENAVKHGVAASRRPVTVRVAARQEGADLVLSVQDDGADAGPPAPGTGKGAGTGVGLANVRARLAALYGAAGRLTARPLSPGFEVEIRMPLAFAETARRAA